MRSAKSSSRLYLVLTVGLIGLVLSGCLSRNARKPQFSPIVSSSDAHRELDAGHIAIHATVARAIPFGTERLTLGQLVDATKIFEMLQSSRQAARLQSTYSGLNVGASLSPPLLQTIGTKETAGRTSKDTDKELSSTKEASDGSKTSSESTRSAELGTERGEASSSEATTTSQAPPFPEPPPGVLTPQSPSATLSVTPYELFYSTAETLLAARSLENLYNIVDGPEGWTLFSIPIVAAFEPGRVTRSNYVAESMITFGEGQQASLEVKLVAVAPAGLSSFASSALSEMSRLQASLGVGIPLSAAALQLRAAAVREAFDAFSSMARRPDLQVSIADNRTLVVRYLGRETFEGGIALSPASFNVEVLALIKPKPTEAKPEKRRSQLVLPTGPGRREVADTEVMKVKAISAFKPAFRTKKQSEAVTVGPCYGCPSGRSETEVQVYVPAVATKLSTALYYPDGRIVLGGQFPEKTCTCFELFAGAETSRTPLVPSCRWLESSVPSLVFEVAPMSHPDAKQKESLTGRISLFEGSTSQESCPTSGLATVDLGRLQSVAPVVVKLSSPPATPAPPVRQSGTAALKAASGSLDNLGATLFIEYTGNADDPLVLVDGLAMSKTRLELIRSKDDPDAVVGGRIWVRVPGVHEPRLAAKSFLLTLGSGDQSTTRMVAAKR